MALKPIKRKYSFSDGVFAKLSDDIMEFARRDLEKFADYGYDDERLTVIEGKIAAFKLLPADDYYTALLMEATADKNTKMKAMGEESEKIVRRAINKFGEDSPKTRRFGYTGYAGKKDADKMTVNRQVHKAATELQTELASEGLTAAIIAALLTKITAADEAITAKKMSVSNRDIGVTTRIKAGNDLYADIVKVADTGKEIFEDIDESLYNDYVIYASQPGVQTVNDAAPANSVHAPSATITNEGDEIEITVESGTLTAYFSDDPTDEPAPGQITFTVTVDSPFSGTAAELGYTSENYRLLLKNDSAAAVAFSVVVRG